jgi:hypothetical protein
MPGWVHRQALFVRKRLTPVLAGLRPREGGTGSVASRVVVVEPRAQKAVARPDGHDGPMPEDLKEQPSILPNLNGAPSAEARFFLALNRGRVGVARVSPAPQAQPSISRLRPRQRHPPRPDALAHANAQLSWVPLRLLHIRYVSEEEAMSDSTGGGVHESISGAAQNIAGAAHQAAGAVQRGSGEVVEVIRAQPIAAVLILFGLGYLLGHVTGQRSR